MEQNNANTVTVNNEAASEGTVATVIVPGLAEKIDFGPLSQIIDHLGNANSQMTESEKQAAREIIAEWESNVVDRLQVQVTDAKKCLDMLSFSQRQLLYIDEDLLEKLSKAADAHDLFEKYIAATEAVLIHRSMQPQEAVKDPDRTIKENMEAAQKYQLDMQLYQMKHGQLERESAKALNRLIGVLNDNEDIKTLKARLKNYCQNATKYRNDCSSKAQAAKIAVSINSPEVRGLLKELVNFSIKL